jgi:cAMP-dependent protein kinase regulator
MLAELGCALAPSNLQSVFTEMDANQDGLITFEDFNKWWKVPISLNVATLKAGVYFGELALLYDSPRAASIVAAEDSKVWSVDLMSFKYIVVAGNSASVTKVKKTLAKVELFKKLREAELLRMAEAMKTVEFQDGENIIAQGAEVDDESMFYIIESGKAAVTLNDGSLKGIYLQAGQYFGENAILTSESRNANITASGAS